MKKDETKNNKKKRKRQSSKLPPMVRLLQLIMGKMSTHLIFVAAKLGIADILVDGPKNVDTIAKLTKTHPLNLYRTLRALTTLGIFAEIEHRVFASTPRSRLLQTNTPDSLRDWAIYCGSDWHNQTWSNLLYSVQTGEPAFDHIFGMGIFDYLEENPEHLKEYFNGLGSLNKLFSIAITNLYDFSKFQTIADIGGGSGALLAEILKKNPLLHGILFDVPMVTTEANQILKSANLEERCKIVSGDFLREVPIGADAYILKNILHNWNDETSRNVLKNIRKEIPPNGTLLIIETVIQSESERDVGKIFDMEMMLFLGGIERTEAEFRLLFESAGFKLTKIIPSQYFYYIIEGQPI